MRLESTSFTETLDMQGWVWYIDYNEIDIENLTLETNDET